MSPSKFNIASMETQTQTHRVGLNPFCVFDGDIDANANSNAKCEQTLMRVCSIAVNELMVCSDMRFCFTTAMSEYSQLWATYNFYSLTTRSFRNYKLGCE